MGHVLDPDWHSRVKIELHDTREIKSYLRKELELVRDETVVAAYVISLCVCVCFSFPISHVHYFSCTGTYENENYISVTMSRSSRKEHKQTRSVSIFFILLESAHSPTHP